MSDIKIPDPPTSPSQISLNGFCGRKAPCFLRTVDGTISAMFQHRPVCSPQFFFPTCRVSLPGRRHVWPCWTVCCSALFSVFSLDYFHGSVTHKDLWPNEVGVGRLLSTGIVWEPSRETSSYATRQSTLVHTRLSTRWRCVGIFMWFFFLHQKPFCLAFAPISAFKHEKLFCLNHFLMYWIQHLSS